MWVNSFNLPLEASNASGQAICHSIKIQNIIQALKKSKDRAYKYQNMSFYENARYHP